MLRLILVLILLGVLAAIGVAGYWAAETFLWKPQRELAMEEEIANRPAPPNPSIAAWSTLEEGLVRMSAPEAMAGAREFLGAYPESPHAGDALEALNNAARAVLFTNQFPEGKGTYTVVSGDSMARISGRQKVNADWILKVNNLTGHDLQVGQSLLLPTTETRLVLRPGTGVLEVWELPASAAEGGEPAVPETGGKLLLVYPLTVSGITSPSPGETAVRERFVTQNGARVAFGSPGYASGDRSIALERSGLTLEALPVASEDPSAQPAMPSGLLLHPADLREVFLLVKKGTPVLIE